MMDPSLSSLLEKVENRFSLVNIASKRARQLINGAPKLSKCKSEKAVTIAANEINENMITYVRTKSGIK
jgi:DNA-directed RNA polymerase subunit omega